MALRGAVAALGLVLAGWPLAAVGQTVISPDVAAGLALGTTVNQSGTVFAIDGGARAGNNLFHSFSQFDLAAGNTARWVRGAGDGASIANVVNRVTGGQVSTIAGTIDSTALPNATFYFVNPAGVVFGPGAQVNVPGAAHFSTAAELRFADGDHFAVATPNGSTLSVAAPEAWGFVGGQGAISITGVGADFAPATANLAFTASDITVSNATFAARGLDLFAVGDLATNVSLADPLSAARGGQVSLDGSRLAVVTTDATGAPARLSGGEVRIAAGNLVSDTAGVGRGGDLVLAGDRIAIAPDGVVISSARGAGSGGDVLMVGGLVEVDGSGGATATGIASSGTAAGTAGDIRLQADDIRIGGGAFANSIASGTGDAGDIQLAAHASLTVNVGTINSASLGDGDAGQIRISAPVLDLGAAVVQSSAFGAGRPADIRVEGDTIVLSGGFFGATPGGAEDSGAFTMTATQSIEGEGVIFGSLSGTPTAFGSITLRAPSVFLAESLIQTQAFDEGAAGQIVVEAESLIFDEVRVVSDTVNGPASSIGLVRLKGADRLVLFNTEVSTNSFGRGDAGQIAIEGGDVEFINSNVNSQTFATTGDAGQISIAADQLTLSNAGISSDTFSEGAGGSVVVSARAVSLDTESSIRSDTFVIGKGGQVTIDAQTLDLRDNSRISADATGGAGDAGEVFIDVGRLTMSFGVISSTAFSIGDAGSVQIRADEIDMEGEFTAIASETLSLGNAGGVAIDAKKITVARQALITSSGAEGDAGNVIINTGELSLLSGGDITSDGFGFGDAGDISIVADKVLVQSEDGFASVISTAGLGGDAGEINLKVGSLVVDAGGISSDTFAGGDAGNVRIDADTILLKNPGGVSSSTNDFGNAGSVEIKAKTLTLEDSAVILSVATSVSNGNAGEVRIEADDIVVGQDASITTATFGRGDAGGLDIASKSLRLDGGQVSSSAEGDATGAASRVRIVTDRLDVLNIGAIATLSFNPNQAGEIEITAGEVTVDGIGSVISSENFADGSGDAGKIFLRADNLTLANGGRITTNSTAGAAGDIEVRIDRPGLLVLEGGEAPGIIQTSSGAGTGGRIIIADPLAIIANGSRILALGEQGGANVQIQSRYFIESTDRPNIIEVDGEFQIQTGLYDVSSGTVSRDLSVLDASKVLRGQCPAARSTGAVSQLITRPVGPYAREPAVDVLDASPPGGCP